MSEFKVHAVAEDVSIGDGIDGVITGIIIRDYDHIQYEVSWWDKSTRHSQWLESFEVKSRHTLEPIVIGFKNPKEARRG